MGKSGIAALSRPSLIRDTYPDTYPLISCNDFCKAKVALDLPIIHAYF